MNSEHSTFKKAESITSPRGETINTGPGFEYQELKDLKTQGPRVLRTVLYCSSYSRDTMWLQVQVHGYVSLSCMSITLHMKTGQHLASFPGHSQILSCSHGEKLGESLVRSITCHRSEWWTWFCNNGYMPRQ